MFVILSHQRAGSNLLRSLLNSHPKLTCYGERWGGREWKGDPWSLGEHEGFLLKYNQVVGKPDRIELLKSARVIHLMRRNKRNQVASYAHMRRSGLDWDEMRPDMSKARVAEKHIHGRRGIRKIRRGEKAVDSFNLERRLDIYYEDLTDDKNITRLPADKARPILEFLGVEVMDLTTDTQKTQLYEIVRV